MSAAMGLVYDSLAELMDACVRELRKSNKLDTTDLTLDQVGGWVGGQLVATPCILALELVYACMSSVHAALWRPGLGSACQEPAPPSPATNTPHTHPNVHAHPPTRHSTPCPSQLRAGPAEEL